MADHYSPMSITQLIHNEDTNRTDIKLAAETLDQLSLPPQPLIPSHLPNDNKSMDADLTIKLPPLPVYSSVPSTTASSPLPTPSSYMSDPPPRFSFSSDASSAITEDDQNLYPSQQQQQPFMDRVSGIPLVNSALRVYEQSTAENVMKYGTDMVGSLTGPIYDKIGKTTVNTVGEDPNHHDTETMAAALARASLTDEFDTGDTLRRRRLDEDNVRKTRSRPHSRSTSPHRPYTKSATSPRHLHAHHRTLAHHPRAKVNRSAWQQLVAHASSAAGTTAAVVSEESMKCLRYCLHWLQYATQHIQQQMHLLRSFLVSLATSSTATTKSVSRANNPAYTQPPSASALADIQKEIILTLRKVVEVVSRYAGAGLPTHAKASVRSFILQLPGRWANLNAVAPPSDTHQDQVPDHVKETSIKLLNFGGESVEMLDSVSTVFSDSIDRAEVWLDRLRVVGVSPHLPHQVDCMET